MKSNVILMVGIPGSGKSKLAKYLSKLLNSEILNRDLIRNTIFPKKFINHSNIQNDIASETLYKVLEYIILNNNPKFIIVDGKPYSRKKEIKEFNNFINKLSSNLIIVNTIAPIDIISFRLQNDFLNKKNLMHRDPNEKSNIYNTEEMIKEFEKINFPHIIIDTSFQIQEVTKNCINKINNFINDKIK